MTPEGMARTYLAAFGNAQGWSSVDFARYLSNPLILATGTDDSFAVGRVVADECEVLTIATAPSCQGKGLGSKNLKALFALTKSKGAEKMFLEVAVDNSNAISLYRKHGFVQVAIREKYYARPAGAVDALILQKRL